MPERETTGITQDRRKGKERQIEASTNVVIKRERKASIEAA